MKAPTVQIKQGDCLEELAKIPDGSCQMCVTSPPYWGLRSYLPEGHPLKRFEIGLEKTPEDYVAMMVGVFREVRRVLREDGTLWVNLGDSYAGGNQGGVYNSETWKPTNGSGGNSSWQKRQQRTSVNTAVSGLKPKDLCGVPWRVAFALQADGWYLRSDIIWAKKNCMPESVTDRPTRTHEYIFLFTKNPTYFYDAEAIKEPVSVDMLNEVEEGYDGLGLKDYEGNGVQNPSSVKARIIANARKKMLKSEGPNSRMHVSRDPDHEREYDGKNRSQDDQWSGRRVLENCADARANGAPHDAPFGLTRNKRSVWNVATKPYREAHFATFPPDLIKPCILAGTSAKGCCPNCGKSWSRIIIPPSGGTTGKSWHNHAEDAERGNNQGNRGQAVWNTYQPARTVDWKPSCQCFCIEDTPDPIPCTVLDPFFGSGTSGEVCLELGRNCIGIDLNPEYIKLAEQRVNVTPGLPLA